jgi:AcrR family transcriptional regulator
VSPRISAPTVAEHRARQHAALVDAARTLLLGQGASAVTPGAVGAAAGLARSSVYEYFPTAGDLLAELAVEAFARWTATVRAAVEAEEPGWPQVDAYLRASLRLVADGEHRIAGLLADAPLPAACRFELRRLHDGLAEPLRAALEALAVPDPALSVALVEGVLGAATREVEAGADPDRVIGATLALVHHGVRPASARRPAGR